MNFKLKINCDSDSLQVSPEVELSYILRDLAQRLEDGETYGVIQDDNGNTIGEYELRKPVKE